MTKTGWLTAKVFLASTMFAAWMGAQSPPPSPGATWHGKEEQGLEDTISSQSEQRYAIDPEKSYTLPELINLAEEHNPVTRQAWETAKARADSLGIARSALYPTMSAVALAATTRDAALIGEYFHRQTIGIFEPVLHVDYLVFDLGGRSGTIDAAKANLLAADLAFNDTHRKLIFETASAYYRLLNAEGQQKAAVVSLENAKTVEEDAQERLTKRTAA